MRPADFKALSKCRGPLLLGGRQVFWEDGSVCGPRILWLYQNVAGRSFWEDDRSSRRMAGVRPADLRLYQNVAGRSFWGG